MRIQHHNYRFPFSFGQKGPLGVVREVGYRRVVVVEGEVKRDGAKGGGEGGRERLLNG